MKKCSKCGIMFKWSQRINGKRVRFCSRTTCLSCTPYVPNPNMSHPEPRVTRLRGFRLLLAAKCECGASYFGDSCPMCPLDTARLATV
jgi:hypothetical protein